MSYLETREPICSEQNAFVVIKLPGYGLSFPMLQDWGAQKPPIAPSNLAKNLAKNIYVPASVPSIHIGRDSPSGGAPVSIGTPAGAYYKAQVAQPVPF
jgi:hypothetical protein